jgi:hypothetical protein
MKASSRRPPTKSPRNKSTYDSTRDGLQDAIGEISYAVGAVEALAVAAVEVAGRMSDDATCRRHLSHLVVGIQSAASRAFAVARSLDEKLEGQ